MLAQAEPGRASVRIGRSWAMICLRRSDSVLMLYFYTFHGTSSPRFFEDPDNIIFACLADRSNITNKRS